MQSISCSQKCALGCWFPDADRDETSPRNIHDALTNTSQPIFAISVDGRPGVRQTGSIRIGPGNSTDGKAYPLLGYAPPLPLESMGDPLFKESHGLRYPLIAGAMANGINSVEIVEAMGRAGMIGFFGSGGLSLAQIEAAIDRLQNSMEGLPVGFNLMHSPYDPALEQGTVTLYLKRGVRRISAAAFLDMTLPLIHYRLHGIHRDGEGNIVCPNKIIAKVSRVEVARKFLSPPPEKLVQALLEKKLISSEQAELARHIPVAEDLTAEADSGGHTDNRPAITLLPTMLALRDELNEKFSYARPICIGLAGGIATPSSVAAAFAMGAAYVLTGSINQACVESGTSDVVRKMLSEAGQADVAMAPSADMFEMGVKVQVLKRGTMFPQRAAKLYELYSQYQTLNDLPLAQKQMLERDYFKRSLEDEWEQTRLFFLSRDPSQVEKAESSPRHKMALVFRSYLGQSSLWAKTGRSDRMLDYQIWCGPAIGAFNEWTRGSFLEHRENRKVVDVNMNLLMGASVMVRRNWLASQGVAAAHDSGMFKPMTLNEISESNNMRVVS